MATMNVCFDGLRTHIAQSFNQLCDTELSNIQREILSQMRSELGGLLACYDPNCPDDMHDLSEKITLTDPMPDKE